MNVPAHTGLPLESLLQQPAGRRAVLETIGILE